MELGNPSFGCELSPIDFVAFARVCGADGFHCERPEEVRPAIQAALRSRPALLGPLSTRSEASRPGRTEDLGRYPLAAARFGHVRSSCAAWSTS
jgi:thiamine pyrophosphate-dependent acetolactate synthase large subunit-like protein